LAFLRDWRATLIAAAALPLSILPAFAPWRGWAIAQHPDPAGAGVIVGILVDDAIVEIRIFPVMPDGQADQDRRADAVTEIALAVVATTFSLVVVFMPPR